MTSSSARLPFFTPFEKGAAGFTDQVQHLRWVRKASPGVIDQAGSRPPIDPTLRWRVPRANLLNTAPATLGA